MAAGDLLLPHQADDGDCTATAINVEWPLVPTKRRCCGFSHLDITTPETPASL